MLIESGSVIDFIPTPPISQEQLRDYAEASGDFNPIHLDEKVAKDAGLPGVIAHGMLIAALLAERASQFVKSSGLSEKYQIESFQTRFKAMTFVGDTPSIGGVVKDRTPERITLEMQVKNQRGEITTLGVVRYRQIREN